MTIGEPLHTFDHPMTPNIDPSLFDGHDTARFWIGKTALFNVIENPEMYAASLVLRARVYVHEMKFLPPTALTVSGHESDIDDDRSVHFAVAEQSRDGKEARVTGTARMIVKRDSEDLLPVEENFPEIFAENPIETDCLEVSRFISRHEDRYLQHVVSLSLIRAMTHFSLKNDVPKVYFEIEEEFWDLLSMIGLPMKKVGDLKPIDEYGGTHNMAVEIDPQEIMDAVTQDKTGTLLLTQFFRSEGPNEGLGYYKTSLIGGGNV